ncbi:MAG: MHS family MFS transporter [Acidobacteria bacterium]|nr:MHS family MFS transporter [Acidobacteriota bacterium]
MVHDSSLPLEQVDRRRQLVRAVAASAVGTTIEWYDFFLYGVAAATVFPQRFFPGSDPFIGTLLSFSTFFVGFLARPMGAALFGHFGDRVGRKALLIITMVMMGTATVGIGLIPSYEAIGVWGAVLLVVGRVLQGLSVGGEWSGSVLMAGEWTAPKHRGFTTSFAQFGAPAGMVLANGALALMTLVTTDAQFVEWGWRIPFLASIVLVFVGLYIRVGVLETPVFSQLKARGAVKKAPLVEVVRRHWREIGLTALLRTGQQVQFYIFTTYIITYATQQLGIARGTILNFVMLQALVSTGTVLYMGHLSDRFGRRRITAIGCTIMLVYPFIYFGLLDTRSIALVFLAVSIALPLHDLQYGPQAAFIAESFPGSLRYSGSSLGYQLASITAGGPAPLIAVLLYRRFGTSTAVAVYMAVCSLISLICVFALRDRTGTLDHY